MDIRTDNALTSFIYTDEVVTTTLVFNLLSHNSTQDFAAKLAVWFHWDVVFLCGVREGCGGEPISYKYLKKKKKPEGNVLSKAIDNLRI